MLSMREATLSKSFDGIEAPQIQPDFFVVGAQKAGTTSLHHWLSAQPQILLPRDKETHYLTHGERSQLGPRWYEQQFVTKAPGARRGSPGDALVGEVDPELLHHPRAPQRIRALFGTPKIVIILRDPKGRARSQHAMSVARGIEAQAFEEALELEPKRLEGAVLDSSAVRHQAYWSRSCYGPAVARYQDVFGTENVLLVRFENLFQPTSPAERLKCYGAILDFIGYTAEARLPESEQVQNAAWEPRLPGVAKLLHGDRQGLRSIGRLIPGQPLRRWIGQCLDRMNRRQLQDGKSSQDSDSGNQLSAHWQRRFDSEVRIVEAMTGWDCKAWYSPDARAGGLEEE